MKFVVGLGNPGRRYLKTRHNVGFLVVDRLAGVEEFKRKFEADYARTHVDGTAIVLVKPQTYMNLSGRAVQSILSYFKGSAEDLLVVHDDLDLPVGQLRFRARGSSGGHKGIESIHQCLGTADFHRLKFGIGRDPRVDPADFVLGKFAEDSKDEVERALDRAADAVRTWALEGFERSAAEFNTRSTRNVPDDKETEV